jgi:hypothetical protein
MPTLGDPRLRRFLVLLSLLATLVAGLGLPAPAAAAKPNVKIAIIVGPVGEELTPVYISLADTAAKAAEDRGATVARAYSPDADETSVLKAVRGANIVIYFGHGVGSPNPYSDAPSPLTTNGWGLNGPRARGDHSDSFVDGTLAYYGEAWIAEHARPAPGWVMIYSNACYAPGAGEGQHEPASRKTAFERVSAYSRGPLVDLGASAYFATDFYEGAAHLVGALLDAPDRPYRDAFMSEPRFESDRLFTRPHATVAGAETWVQRSRYFEGKLDYWYAFAGDPDASLASGPVASTGGSEPEQAASATFAGSITGMASSYSESRGWKGKATVALPLDLGGGIPDGEPKYVLICADRCVSLPVVDSCPCYAGTADERVANLSHEAWRQISDMPLEEGLIEVEIVLSPIASGGSGPPMR